MQIALYAPIALVVCLVLATLREDAPATILKTALKNFAILTLVLAGGTVLIFAMSAFF